MQEAVWFVFGKNFERVAGALTRKEALPFQSEAQELRVVEVSWCRRAGLMLPFCRVLLQL